MGTVKKPNNRWGFIVKLQGNIDAEYEEHRESENEE